VVLLSVGTLADDRPAKPAEETRFSAAAFRAGLKKRGLTELLDLHLKEFPPTGKVATLLLRRDLKLVEFAETARPKDERMAAAAEANRLLEEVIHEEPHDRRRFEWRFTLAHSLLYDEAEPFFTSILYRGGSKEDRLRLQALTARAVATLTVLTEQLAQEYERIDNLSIRKFEQLEQTGYVDILDRLAPRAHYLLLWALLYDSLSRDDTDPMRASRLNRILTAFTDNPAVLETSHDISRVQVQALLLAGMTYRLLNDHPTARRHLNRALNVADRLEDPTEQQRIRWAITLAQIERVRNDCDDDRYDDAIKGIARLRRFIAGGDDDFGLWMVAALLERSVHQAHASAAESEGQTLQASRYRDEAWKPLETLVRRHPDRRDEVYATLYDLIKPGADPAALDPFERCALVAGLLLDADRQVDEADTWLDRAIEVGERFVAEAPVGAESLVPEVLYNVAVAYYRRGRPAEAATRFLEVARNHPEFDSAVQAASFAAQLASALYEDETLRNHPEVRQLYLDALEVLLMEYSATEAARYWRFYYAQFLAELGRYDAAATQYALVDADHKHYLESIFFQVRSTALGLEEFCRQNPSDLLSIRRRINEFFEIHRAFVTKASSRVSLLEDPEQADMLPGLIGRAKLVAAEVQVLPQVDRPDRALEGLTGFEADHPDLAGLTGRVWRVRLVAYEKLGRLDEAERAIPAYITADPEGSGPALQSLYVGLADDVEPLRISGDERAAQRKAELALLLAQQVHEWSQRYQGAAAPTDQRRLLVQLAEANLAAGRYARARELFEQCQEGSDDAVSSEASHNVAVIFGHAESLFHLDDFADALPQFNELARKLPEADPMRWKSLLRDLQCRTALGHPPGDIIKVIEQQRHLFPELGGPHLTSQFEKLLRENRRRLDSG
jgi:tetratricopeptide (TPR) repeat protein